jgi:hypothetical protein
MFLNQKVNATIIITAYKVSIGYNSIKSNFWDEKREPFNNFVPNFVPNFGTKSKANILGS